MADCVSYNHGSIVAAREKLDNKVYNGYSYVFSKKNRSTLYVVCVQRKIRQCKGTGKIIDGKFYNIHPHNHAASKILETIFKFEKALHHKVVQDRFKSLKSIYDETSLLYSHAAVRKTWLRMESKMQYWRKEVQPPIPKSLLDYQIIMDSSKWNYFTKNHFGKMHVTTIQSEDLSYATLYGNIKLLKCIQTTHLLIDATFQVVPKKPRSLQLLTILALIHNTAIPILWVLMERKTTAAYTKVLKYLNSILAPRLKPAIIISDFELSLSLSIQMIYPDALHIRCFFHYCQALIKRLKKLRLIKFIRQWKNGEVIMKKFLAIPLLPPQNIIDAFEWLINNIPDVIKTRLNKFITYYQQQWMKRVGPKRLSVYRNILRTNNHSEAYNRVLAQKLGVHPPIWKFTMELNHFQQNSLLEYKSLAMGNLTKRAMRNQNIIHEKRLKIMWDFYELGMLNVPQFLACASYDLKAFSKTELENEEASFELVNEEIFQEFDVESTLFI